MTKEIEKIERKKNSNQPTTILGTDSFACAFSVLFIHSISIFFYSFVFVFSNLTTIEKMLYASDLDKSICYFKLKINQYAK